MAGPSFTIDAVHSTDDLAEVASLFREYAASLGIDLSFQHFDEEVSQLPGDYAEPRGTLLVARVDDTAAGCVGLRPLANRICEMKRLYVRPLHRGSGLGEALTLAVIAAARQRQYEHMRLDTLPSMQRARALYTRLGFREIAPYRFNPVEGTSFLELTL
jgi:ribosomal protein S18 acetylase RimI-like enzyme